jgi:hypothetical protein
VIASDVRAASPALCLLLVWSAGCWDMLPASKDPISDAEHREQEVCPRGAPTYPKDLFSPSSVAAVSPLYYTKSERGYQGQYLFGATISRHPLPGLSSQDLEWMLDCHAVRSQLRRPGEPVVPNDPYWVPGHVVRISVAFEEGVTRVKVEGRDFATAQEILTRARAFVGQSAPENQATPDSGVRL